MALRSSTGWRSTMSISLSPSRYWPMVVPDSIVRAACAMRLAGDAERARLVLVDVQAQHLDRLVPVVVDAAHVGVGAQDLLGLVGPARARLPTSGPTTRNCTGYGTGGPLGSSLTRPRTSGNSLGQQRRQPLAQRLARRQVLRQHDELADVGLREDLVERQVEARHAACRPRWSRWSTPGSLHHARLEARGQRLALLDRRAFGQPQVDQHLGPARIGEELLLHACPCRRCRARSVSSVSADRDPAVLARTSPPARRKRA